MAATLTLTKKWRDGQRTHYVFTPSFSGSYVTGGEVPTAPERPPLGSFNFQDSESLNGYRYTIDRSNGKVKILSGSTELAAAAYPAGVTGDVARIHVVAEI